MAHARRRAAGSTSAPAGLDDVDQEVVARAVPFLKRSKGHYDLVSHEPVGRVQNLDESLCRKGHVVEPLDARVAMRTTIAGGARAACSG